ncbi:hypothetical protein KI387_022624, partial [Taxus chinensis]
MGNCLQYRVCEETGDDVLTVMGMDGKMMENTPPPLRNQITSDNGSHGADHRLFQKDSVDNGGSVTVEKDVVIRLKIMVSKQQLKALLSDGFVEEKIVGLVLAKQLQSTQQGSRWRPNLERIAE